MHGDLYATKGIEYLVVIAYLMLMGGLAGWLALARHRRRAAAAARNPVRPAWAGVADGLMFHQGHAWAGRRDGAVVTVGLDGFAAGAVGAADEVLLPPVGATLQQGGPGWTVRAGERRLAMLSPVDGEVEAVNPAVLASPRLASDDPYGAGWLLKVRAAEGRAWIKNLFSGELAAVWLAHAEDRLRRMRSGGLGVVMADGGAPERGFARTLGEEEWRAVAREFFLTA